MSAVGEYAGDYGFPLPNPVSMRPEYPRSRLPAGSISDRVVHADTS